MALCTASPRLVGERPRLHVCACYSSPGSGWTACLREAFPRCARLWLGEASHSVGSV